MTYLEQNNLKELVSSGVHLVAFYAEWCGPCKMLGTVLEQIQDKIDIIKVDMDKFYELAMERQIMSVPTLLFYRDGRVVQMETGFKSQEELLQIINSL